MFVLVILVHVRVVLHEIASVEIYRQQLVQQQGHCNVASFC